MNDNVTMYQQLHGSDQLALIFEAGKRTRDEAYFTEILALLDTFIAAKNPNSKHSLKAIKHKLITKKGTPLEPFILGERNLELAARFVQLALSEKAGRRMAPGAPDRIRNGDQVSATGVAGSFPGHSRRRPSRGWSVPGHPRRP